jgi:inosine-uridine nucleoside N-ribohydrolase
MAPRATRGAAMPSFPTCDKMQSWPPRARRSEQGPRHVSKTKILIDCDPGHDDAVAILFAARHLDVVGITTVHGNSTVENTTRNALAIMELAGIDVPLAMGCAGPLAQRRVGAAPVHGKGGLDGADLPVPKRQPVGVHAVDFIIDVASRYRGELVLATIGPETNVALALTREPQLAGWLREITVMGGSTGAGNVTAAAEFNIYCDPEAACAVFNCGAQIRMVGLNVTRRTGFNQTDIGAMKASGRKVASVVAGLMAFYLGRQREQHGLDVAPMHDVCAIVPYTDAALLEYLRTRVEVELAGTHTRGMTLCDLRPARLSAAEDQPERNALVATDANSRALIGRVIETLLSYD